MTTLTISLLQTDLLWRKPQNNRENIKNRLESLTNTTDLVVLPEVFTSGFAAGASWTEEELSDLSETLSWMKSVSSELNFALAGSTVWPDKDAMRNRLYFSEPDGKVSFYDKCHLFRMAGENKRYVAGTEKKVIEFRGFRILLTICYDIRFPVFCRNTGDYDLILCVANWPKQRHEAWQTLLKARAIENQAYVVGVNRVGEDGKGLQYDGGSCVLDYEGNSLCDFDNGEQGLKSTVINLQALEKFRKVFPVWQDSDAFSLDLSNLDK